MESEIKNRKDVTAFVRGGKRVRQDHYIHISLLAEQPASVQSFVEGARCLARINQENFNVIRLSQRGQIGFLHYDRFFEDPFPKLITACLVDLITEKVSRTNFTMSDNPPILHRKELLLPAEHPNRSQSSALTEALERRGLFKNNKRIGHQRQWEDRLAAHGIQIADHVIVEMAAAEKVSRNKKEIERHRTAIVRDRLSAPMQALARHGLLVLDRTVLDYGCGQGDDVRALQAGGIPVIGWDPHFAPKVQLAPADIVNVGFVLNVIEEPHERVQTIRRAYDLSRQCLAVAVMLAGTRDIEGYEPYRDGFLTSRGTFQKYYRQEEFKEFLESALRTEAIAVAPGVFFVFKDKFVEQRFLLDRQRRIQVPLSRNLRPPLDRPTLAKRRLEALRPILERLWSRMLDSGRPLVDEEVPLDLLSEIEQHIGSLRRAERLCSAQFDIDELVTAGKARKEDLLVYFGLNLFNGRTRYSSLVSELQRDIKVLFGNGTAAFEAARALLFSVGKTEVIEEACRQAASVGCGHLFDGHSLQIHSSQVNRLPAALRCYVGCASKLYGDIDTADLVKIHIQSGKLTLLFYDDFSSSPLPRLRERVKINMRTQRIEFFRYFSASDSQLLYLKSRYMTADQDGYDRQKAFDDELARVQLFDFDGYGPPVDTFNSKLANAGYEVRGFHLEKTGGGSRLPN